MRRNVLVGGLVAFFLLFFYRVWWWTPEDEAAPSGVVVVTDRSDAGPPLVATAPPAKQTSSFSNIAVLETATADDTGPGSAVVRDGNGEVMRVSVGGWIAGGELTAVSDTDATFYVDRMKTVLVVKPDAAVGNGIASGDDGYRVPANVSPGISRP